jgi:hypothetical protein
MSILVCIENEWILVSISLKRFETKLILSGDVCGITPDNEIITFKDVNKLEDIFGFEDEYSYTWSDISINVQ